MCVNSTENGISIRNRASRPSTRKARFRIREQQIAIASSALILFESIKKDRGSEEEPQVCCATGESNRPAGVLNQKHCCGAVAEVAATVAARRAIDGLVDERGHWPRVSAGCHSRPRRSACCCCRSDYASKHFLSDLKWEITDSLRELGRRIDHVFHPNQA